jgi:imidazole glycerol phosphate synthase glutamine amidotransferase subunit
MIGIITTGGGNIRSLSNALNFLGMKHALVDPERNLDSFSALILPGVGHFETAVRRLGAYDYNERIRAFHSTGKIIVGICLGFQILFERSDEAKNCKGLSLLEGRAEAFTPTSTTPNMNVGWRNIWSTSSVSPLAEYNGNKFYFMHCFRVPKRQANNESAWSTFGNDQFLAAVWEQNVRAFQFHPEKSGMLGVNLLKKALTI